MRAERRLRTASAAALAAAIALALAPPARAEAVYGTLQLQYQNADQNQVLVLGGGQSLQQHSTRELWLRTLDMHHQTYLRPVLLMESNFRVTQQSLLGQRDLTSTPQGSVRLIHPWFQFIGMHQPATVRSSLSSQSGLNPDSTTRRQVTSRNIESLVTGHLAAPRWPQVDATWVHHKRDGAGSVGDASTTRSARVGFDREWFSLYGSVNEDRRGSAAPGSIGSRQQVLAAGGTSRVIPLKNTSLTMQYDFSDIRGTAGGIRRPSTTSHSAALGGDWRPSPRLTGTMSYQFRHIDFGTLTNPAQTDHEAGAMLRFAPSRVASLVTGTGLRTVRFTRPGGTADEGLQRYVMAVASLESRVRRNWTSTLTASHTTSWDPGAGHFGVQSVGGSSRAALTRRIQLDGSMQVTSNGDTATTAQRVSNSWNLRAQGTPLRTLLVSYAIRNSRVGPAFWRASAVNRGKVVDVQWRIMPAFSLLGTYGSNESVPSSAGRSSTRSVSGRWDPSRAWHWFGSWTRSDQQTVTSVAGALSSREQVSSRLQYEPTRRLATSAGITLNEPGRTYESRQVDLALTWSFGR